MSKGYDYNWHGYALTLHFPDGKTAFLQGEESAELYDTLEACKTQEQVEAIIEEYDLIAE